MPLLQTGCCRYAKCPRTRYVPGKGLQTRGRLLQWGFCRGCWDLLYGDTHPSTTRWKIHRRRGEIFDETWSMRFICCVEPTCPFTRANDTTTRHCALGFCSHCYEKLAAPPRKCSRCGEVQRITDNDEKGSICIRCYPSVHRAICHICGREGFPYARTKKGAICQTCHSKAYEPPHKACSGCGRVLPVVQWTDAGPLCDRCYKRPRVRCAHCGEVREAHVLRPEGPICARCHHREAKETCVDCGRLQPVAQREVSGGALCCMCARRRRPREVCSRCGRPGLITQRAEDGPVCNRCYVTPEERCSECGEKQPVVKRTSQGPLCRRCLSRQRPRAECVRCGQVRRVEGRTAEGGALCGSCSQRWATCAGCGRVRPVKGVLPGGGGPLCSMCSSRRRGKVRCVSCGRVRRAARRSEQGPLCRACHRAACAMCGKSLPVHGRTPHGPVCRRCYLSGRTSGGTGRRPVAGRMAP